MRPFEMPVQEDKVAGKKVNRLLEAMCEADLGDPFSGVPAKSWMSYGAEGCGDDSAEQAIKPCN
jgi:hypothetical protein